MPYNILFLLTVIISLCSCSTKRESIPGIPEETFINLYSDLLIIREDATLRAIQSGEKQSAIDSIYQNYGVTEAIVQSRIDHYKRNLSNWKEFHEKVTKRLELLHNQMVANTLKR